MFHFLFGVLLYDAFLCFIHTLKPADTDVEKAAAAEEQEDSSEEESDVEEDDGSSEGGAEDDSDYDSDEASSDEDSDDDEGGLKGHLIGVFAKVKRVASSIWSKARKVGSRCFHTGSYLSIIKQLPLEDMHNHFPMRPIRFIFPAIGWGPQWPADMDARNLRIDRDAATHDGGGTRADDCGYGGRPKTEARDASSNAGSASNCG